MRILLIGSECQFAGFVNRGSRRAQHTVDIASSIAEAEGLIAVQHYDLLIINATLPDGDRRLLCQRLRAGGATILGLLLTTKAPAVDVLDNGVDDYWTELLDFTRWRASTLSAAAMPPSHSNFIA